MEPPLAALAILCPNAWLQINDSDDHPQAGQNKRHHRLNKSSSTASPWCQIVDASPTQGWTFQRLKVNFPSCVPARTTAFAFCPMITQCCRVDVLVRRIVPLHGATMRTRCASCWVAGPHKIPWSYTGWMSMLWLLVFLFAQSDVESFIRRDPIWWPCRWVLFALLRCSWGCAWPLCGVHLKLSWSCRRSFQWVHSWRRRRFRMFQNDHFDFDHDSLLMLKTHIKHLVGLYEKNKKYHTRNSWECSMSARRVRPPFGNYMQCTVSHIPLSLGMIRQAGAQTDGRQLEVSIQWSSTKRRTGGRAIAALTQL